MSVLLVRPKYKLTKSLAAFSHAGLNATGIALIDNVIRPDDLDRLAHHPISDSDIVVCVSPFAARTALGNPLITRQIRKAKRIIAVGSSTALCFKARGLESISPENETSEGVLALEDLHSVSDRKIIILKGMGGRTLIADTLIQRGAIVTPFSVYERQRLQSCYQPDEIRPDEIVWIVVTSAEQAELLASLNQFSWTRSKHWIVVSNRIAHLLEDKGIQQISVSTAANDDALIAKVRTLMER
ncbi:uroporphyrinogen-III synthase [Aestuariibacter sp. AA17]|uniref:Uroporphyrinogen-III synthase n=1 Tax=Fluctibacter corallii TaxID=2984329 RepID=A0ABT3ABX4_9ALTE|nr:uroporphyrinogen-III synthase [Aestuariibacter sp. AA17]MCV2886182.1 uroporphyrinogen-III synthase [Aestuariibacter sp. AA17]